MWNLGENIKYYRKSIKMTQQQLADALGIARSTVTCYETGLNEPDVETLKKLADIFDVSLDELLGRET